ncbi:hypothetical protein AEGHOMDF_1747 [Methylobacterium soli]|nr:hypothetical protein AEGHOMDF_1747 [Methylobacterium soli]
MGQGDLRGELKQARGAVLQHPVAALGVALHLRPLLRGQRPGLEQDAVRNADLADIVHGRGQRDVVGLALGEAEPLRDRDGAARHPGEVVARIVVAELGREHQALDDLALARLRFGHHARHVAGHGPGRPLGLAPGERQLDQGAHAHLQLDGVEGPDQHLRHREGGGGAADRAGLARGDEEDRRAGMPVEAAQGPDDLRPAEAVLVHHHERHRPAREFPDLLGAEELDLVAEGPQGGQQLRRRRGGQDRDQGRLGLARAGRVTRPEILAEILAVFLAGILAGILAKIPAVIRSLGEFEICAHAIQLLLQGEVC